MNEYIEPMSDLLEEYGSEEQAVARIRADGGYVLPLGYGEHGPGTSTFYVGSVHPALGEWDSGLAGFIVFRKGCVKNEDEARAYADDLLDELSKWMNGDAYLVTLIDSDGDDTETYDCLGYDGLVDRILDVMPSSWTDFTVCYEDDYLQWAAEDAEEEVRKRLEKPKVTSNGKRARMTKTNHRYDGVVKMRKDKVPKKSTKRASTKPVGSRSVKPRKQSNGQKAR
ncbi:MAG: hypothetical protein E7Z63_01080 [Thermoplasmata archaeon]|nr:hypothetical protein [Thermoplasmata archaeon]